VFFVISRRIRNTYKGLVGFYLLFNDLDSGDEGRGFRRQRAADAVGGVSGDGRPEMDRRVHFLG
jgi:hypothetical protein